MSQSISIAHSTAAALSKDPLLSLAHTNGRGAHRQVPLGQEKRPERVTTAVEMPEVHVNGNPVKAKLRLPKASPIKQSDAAWGSHFWVTLIDPQVCLGILAAARRFIFTYSAESNLVLRVPRNWPGVMGSTCW